MENQKQSKSMELIQEAESLGLLNPESTIICSDCKAVFPKEYNNCPQCDVGTTYQELKIISKIHLGIFTIIIFQYGYNVFLGHFILMHILEITMEILIV